MTQSRIAASTASLSVRAPASTQPDLGAFSTHALDVRLLAAHVLGAHVDDALEPEQRARRGGRDAVLAGARLRDHSGLAHAAGEQRLPQRIVDLVRAGVRQVLALEPDLATGQLGQTGGVVERRGPAHIIAQQGVQLVAVGEVGARRKPGSLELVQRRDERLRHVAAAVGTEARSIAGALMPPSPSAASAASTARKNASSLAWSLRPGSASVPLALSTANGRACSIARRRCPASSPPEHHRRRAQCRRASSQSKLSPVPPGARGEWASSRWKSVANALSACCRRRRARRLRDLAAGAAGRLAASRRALVAVQLEQAEVAAVGQLRDLVERGVRPP